MQTHRRAALVLVAIATLAACGSSTNSDGDASTASVDGEVVAVGAAPLPGDGGGSLGDAVEVAAGAPGDAAAATCEVERRTLDLASEAYELLEGAVATSQQELLDAQMIREASTLFDVSADGTIVPAAGSPCS